MSEYSYYIHPYFIFNFLIGLVYPALRVFGLKTPGLASKDSWGFPREYSIITGILTLIVLRYLRYFTNMKKFVNDVLFFIKCGNAIILYFVDFRIFCWYLFACVVIWILFRIPMYSGPSNILYIPSEEAFKEKVSKKTNKKGDYYWFVIFYSNYSENCVFVSNRIFNI